MDVRKQKHVAPNRRFPASAYMILTAVQERSLGCASDDDTGKGYPPQKFENRDEWLGTGDYIPSSGIVPYILAAKPPPSFLIPHSSFEQRFHPQSRDAPRARKGRLPPLSPFSGIKCISERLSQKMKKSDRQTHGRPRCHDHPW